MSKQWWIKRGTNTWTEDEGLGEGDFYDYVREYEFKNSIHVVDYGAIAEKDFEITTLNYTIQEMQIEIDQLKEIIRMAQTVV